MRNSNLKIVAEGYRFLASCMSINPLCTCHVVMLHVCICKPLSCGKRIHMQD